MRLIFQITLLILYISASNSSLYNNVKGSLSEYLKRSFKNLRDTLNLDETTEKSRYKINYGENDIAPKKKPKAIIRFFKTASGEKPHLRHGIEEKRKSIVASKTLLAKIARAKNEPFRLDPVLNNFRRNSKRDKGKKLDTTTSDSNSSSSSVELKNWKDEWKQHWVKKKLEAINASKVIGDEVNMVAARPLGVPCGDPGQHDMPWGTCMLAMQCEAEYRIYRGDFLCGRTQYVCCALQLTTYDMYQGFDVSFADSGLTTDSEEKRNRGKGSKERRRRRRRRQRKRRAKERQKRKKKIKKNIKKIIREIKRIMNRQYRNGTTQRKKKTRQLKRFIKDLKKKYKKDRNTVKNVHEIEMVKIDAALMKKINEIKSLNRNFVRNATFRDIVTNGTINKKEARMLVQAYPDLVPYFADKTRRTGDASEPVDDLDYDVEYGMLYY